METVFSSILTYRAFAHPQRIAYMFEGKVFTYDEYYKQSAAIAKYLQSLGLKKGDRIGLLDLNTPQAVHFISGAMLIGVIPVSLNWRAMPQEINFIINDAGIKHFFYGATFSQLINTVQFSTQVQLHKIEDEIAVDAKDKNDYNENISPEDTCVILYTSGTTGNPKGVLISYKNIYSCYQLCAWDTPSFGPDARNLVCGPLYSIFGFGAFFSCIYAGATNVLVRMFEPNMVAKIMSETKVTNALLVPIMIKLICMVDGIEKFDFNSLKHIQYGGSPISADTLTKAYKLFNCYFTQVYGLTESAGVGCSLRFDDHAKILSGNDNALLLSAGKPSLGIEMKIIDDNGNELASNEPGEVLFKGENIAAGYWNASADQKKMFADDDWLKTGDIGYLDEEGYLFLIDRKNDKIVSKGVNIFPAEIERVLENHPLIKEVAVIAVPDDKAGEAVCAAIVLKDGELDLAELQSWCKGKISDHKIPKHIVVKKELPRNPTGKILRRLMREPFWQNEERKIKG